MHRINNMIKQLSTRLLFIFEMQGTIMQLALQLPVQSMPITSKIVSYNPAHGEMYSIQHIVINLSATCNRSVVFSEYFGFLRVLLFSPSTLVFSEYFGFLRVLWFSASIKLTTMHDIAEILLKVSLNTITRQI